MPVLPLVGSMTTDALFQVTALLGGFRIIVKPMRSFTEPSGLKNSGLSKMSRRRWR